MKKFLVMVVVVMAVFLTGCGKQSLTRAGFVGGRSGGPWGYIAGVREVIKTNVNLDLTMRVHVKPLVVENEEEAFFIESPPSVLRTETFTMYYLYRVRPGTYSIEKWDAKEQFSSREPSRAYNVNYVFEVEENTITYLGRMIFRQYGTPPRVVGNTVYNKTLFGLQSTNAMDADMAIIYEVIPEVKDLRVTNRAWEYTSSR